MSLKTMFKRTAIQVSNVINNIPAPTVQDIHDEFDNAADKALEEAQVIIDKGLDNKKEELANRMNALGFSSIPLVTKVSKEREVFTVSSKEASIILKYKEKYPHHKFIFLKQVHEICKKYNLIFGKSSRYIGNIPLKNLEEISDFKALDEDIYYERDIARCSDYMIYSTYYSPTIEEKIEDSHTDFVNQVSKLKETTRSFPVTDNVEDYKKYMQEIDKPNKYNYTKVPFFICAPVKDMKLQDNERLEDGKIKVNIPDPIVLHWVKDGFLVVSKWGLESEDELLND